MPKLLLDMGHTLRGAGYGAVGVRAESEVTREVGKEVMVIMRNNGWEVVDCSCDSASSESASLRAIVDKANKNGSGATLFCSIHFNAFNGSAKGTEVYVDVTNGNSTPYANRIVNNIAGLGYYNRGVKNGGSYYVLANTHNIPALLVECCFVDSSEDMSKYNYKTMAKAIAEGILNKSVSENIPTPPPTPPTPPATNCDKEIKRYTEYGKCTITEPSGIIFRDKPCTCHGKKQGSYYHRESVNYDLVVITDKYVWISWTSASTGARRYMPITDRKLNEKWAVCV